MQIPVGLKPGLWGAVAGAIAMSMFGFARLGWVTQADSQKMSRESADTAVIETLVPFCVSKAQADPNPAILTKFQAEQSSYSRGDMVTKAGWASFGGKAGSDALARACAEKLHVTKAS